MFKYFFLFFFMLGNLFANTIIGKIQKIDNDFAYVEILPSVNVKDLNLGVFVLKNVGDNSSIVARGSFVNIDNNIAKFELYTFSDLKQSALPIPVIMPSVDDDVILNNFIDKTILIAPNKEKYENTMIRYNNFDFINPNILAAKIYKDSQLLPTRNDFRDFCKTWAIGSVMIVLKDRISLYECSSLKLITDLEINIDNNSVENLNFYSDVAKNLGEKINYFDYYTKIFNKIKSGE